MRTPLELFLLLLFLMFCIYLQHLASETLFVFFFFGEREREGGGGHVTVALLTCDYVITHFVEFLYELLGGERMNKVNSAWMLLCLLFINSLLHNNSS